MPIVMNTILRRQAPAALALLLLLAPRTALAVPPPGILTHQGRITVDGVNHHGPGHFKFAIVNGAGTAVWSNSPDGNTDGVPDEAVSVTVTHGLYSVGLGDTSVTHMAGPIPASTLASANDLRLRVWFSDDGINFEALSPDQRLTSAPFALSASIADTVALSSISSGMIADGTITSADLATSLRIDSLGLGVDPGGKSLQVLSNTYDQVPLFQRDVSSVTDTIIGLFRLQASTSGQMQDSFGGSINFELNDADGVLRDTARIAAHRDGDDALGALRFQVLAAGGTDPVDVLKLDANRDAILWGDLHVGWASTTDDDAITFDRGAASLEWKNAQNRFRFSKDIDVDPDGDLSRIFFHGDGSYLEYDGDPQRFTLSKDLTLSRDLHVQGDLTVSGSMPLDRTPLFDTVGIGVPSTARTLEVLATSFNEVPLITRTTGGDDIAYGVFRLSSSNPSHMGNGFGTSMSFEIDDLDTTESVSIAQVAAVRDGADNMGKLSFRVANGGDPAEVMTLSKDGDLTLTGSISAASLSPVASEFNTVPHFTRGTGGEEIAYGAFRLTSSTSGDMADGFGTAMTFGIDDAGTVESVPIAQIAAVRDGADNMGKLSFHVANGGDPVEQLALLPNGSLAVGLGSASDDDYIFFDRSVDETGRWLRWRERYNQFQFSTDLKVAGTTTTNVLEILGGADLAEPFPMSEPEIAAGSVVVIDPSQPGRLCQSGAAYDRKVAGVISGANGIRPGITLIQEDQLEPGQNVALTGRVYVRANTSSGPIEPGDLLTTSDTPGEAMKAADPSRAPGAVLGKAMTRLESDAGLVLVLVNLQ